MPVVGLIDRSPEPILDLQRLSTLHTPHPCLPASVLVVLVDRSRPAGTGRFSRAHSGILAPTLVDVVDVSVGAGCPDHLRDGLCESPKVDLRFLRYDEACFVHRQPAVEERGGDGQGEYK